MAHDIAHELDIAASPEVVFDAITTQAGLAGWWTTDCFAEPAVDTISEFGFDGRAVVLSMRIDLFSRPALVHWQCIGGPDEWVDTSLAFRIQPHPEGGCTLRFWHGGWERENGDFPRVSYQWALSLDSLRRYCETGVGSPA